MQYVLTRRFKSVSFSTKHGYKCIENSSTLTLVVPLVPQPVLDLLRVGVVARARIQIVDNHLDRHITQELTEAQRTRRQRLQGRDWVVGSGSCGR